MIRTRICKTKNTEANQTLQTTSKKKQEQHEGASNHYKLPRRYHVNAPKNTHKNKRRGFSPSLLHCRFLLMWFPIWHGKSNHCVAPSIFSPHKFNLPCLTCENLKTLSVPIDIILPLPWSGSTIDIHWPSPTRRWRRTHVRTPSPNTSTRRGSRRTRTRRTLRPNPTTSQTTKQTVKHSSKRATSSPPSRLRNRPRNPSGFTHNNVVQVEPTIHFRVHKRNINLSLTLSSPQPSHRKPSSR